MFLRFSIYFFWNFLYFLQFSVFFAMGGRTDESTGGRAGGRTDVRRTDGQAEKERTESVFISRQRWVVVHSTNFLVKLVVSNVSNRACRAGRTAYQLCFKPPTLYSPHG